MERDVILGRLLQKYEKSMHLLQPGRSHRRVMLRAEKKDFPEYDFENASVRDSFNAAAEDLERRGAVSLSWRVPGVVLTSITLVLDSVGEAYELAGRQHPGRRAQDVISAVGSGLGEVSTPWIGRWKETVCRQAAETYQVPGYCRDGLSFLSGLLTALRCYDLLPGSGITVRAFSIRCFQNSKEFERTYQNEFLRLARQYDDGLSAVCGEQELSQRDQLAYLGIYARPELYELAGRCTVRMESGTVDLAPFYPLGIALPSTQVEHVLAFQMDGIHRIVFIENKTNYDEFLQSEMSPDTLAVYQGGFLSPAKRRMFQALGRDAGADTEVFFWGDVDLGGFQMFAQLQEIIPALKPMRMSAEIVRQFCRQGLARPQTYLDRLQQALENGRYPLFSDAIQAILELGVTIEQEVFCGDGRETGSQPEPLPAGFFQEPPAVP